MKELKIYKVLGGSAAIYVSADEAPMPCDLELYLNSELVSSVSNQNKDHVFRVEKCGEYSVLAKQGNAQYVESNKLSFSMADLQLDKSLVLSGKTKAANFSFDEPEIDDVSEFYVLMKVKKSDSWGKNKSLSELLIRHDIQKKNFDLTSFQETHSIHGYEYYRTSKNLSWEYAQGICEEFEGIEGVVYCSIVPVLENLLPPKLMATEELQRDISNDSDTPDFSGLQGYLDEPHGMNIRDAWRDGFTGESTAIRHLDFGIYKGHEDFQGGNITVVYSRDEEMDCNHGTASTGCIAASANGFGVTGIAHSSSFYFYDTDYIETILEQAKLGDIVSIDNQVNSNGTLLPMISRKFWWDAMHNIVEKGAIVIAAAGNGGQDLSDTSICPDYGDSGAMLVGSCSSSDGRRRHSSNYGHYSSVINSWGDSVVTTGYSSLQQLPGNNRNYTKTYNGTSSATPLCAGSLALLQNYAKKQGVILTAESMKTLLDESSYTEGVGELIGKRPNVAQLFTRIDNLILSSLEQGNPFPVSSNYINHNAFFKSGFDGEVRINFDYRFSDIKHTGVVAYHSKEGPTELEWYSYGESRIKIPVTDEDGQSHVIYMRASKVNSGGEFTMNSAADIKGKSPGQFDFVLKLMADDNKYLPQGKYSGVLPLYIKSYSFDEYNLPVRLNVFIE